MPSSRRAAALVLVLLARGAGADAAPEATPTPAVEVLIYLDALGNEVKVAPEEAPAQLPPGEGQRQVPKRRAGTKASAARTDRLRGEGGTGVDWFPSKQPGLAPYLSGLAEYGNTASQPGGFIADDPLSRGVQRLKYTLSEYGLYYELAQALQYTSVTHVAPPLHDLGYYSYDFFFKQSLFHFLPTGAAAWISGELYGGAALGAASRRTTPAEALRSITDPAGSLWGFYGIAVAELAWQHSFADGKLVALAGVIDQANYLDVNAYANFSLGQFLNSAFVNSQVLPLTAGNFGLNVQWQPDGDFYAILGVGPNNAAAGAPPWDDVGGDNMSYLLEAGFAPSDLAGLGPGAYRLQPFIASVEGTTQGGVGFNFNQQLGRKSPFGVFARLGVGAEKVTDVGGARAQTAAGIVLQSPLHRLGLLGEGQSNFFGLGFVWSQPAESLRPAAHANEYGVELLYFFQITATAFVTPDLQFIIDPADNADLGSSLVFQLPLVTTW